MNRREHSRGDHDGLRRVIQSWNKTRVELFKISSPNEKGEFSGVMKFFYQYEEKDGQKVATKCIKVSSADTVSDVIEVLVQKFRPDLKMLPNLSSYSLYEIHNESQEGDVRKMDLTEKPLIEMMRWSEGDRDGRFLLRNELLQQRNRGQKKSSSPKKVKKVPKSPKEKRKPKARSSNGELHKDNDRMQLNDETNFADTLYENYPPSKFTKSITNPEIAQNFWHGDKRMRSSHQAIDELAFEENSVPIITESLLPSKTILATNNDSAAQIVQSTVDKFQLNADPNDFCLVEVTLPLGVGGGRHNGMGGVKGERMERVLLDDECPVKLHTRWMLGEPGVISKNILQFQLRRRASFRKASYDHQESVVPCLIYLSHVPPNAPPHFHKKYPITSFPVEIGSQFYSPNHENHICISSPHIASRHCVISCTSKETYTIQPIAGGNATPVIVNDQPIQNVASLPIDSVIKLSEHDIFKFTITSASNHSRSNSVAEKFRDQAYSVDNLTPTANEKDHLHVGPVSHSRTFSEHTLKGEIGVLEEEEDQEKEEEKDQFNATDDDSITTGSITNIKTTRNNKKRHNSAPHSGDFHFLEETPESELAVLPASISFTHQHETKLLQTLISDINGGTLEFKLAPAYALYMIARHHLSSEYHPESSRHHSLIYMIKQTCSLIKRAVRDSKNVAGALAFWLSNTSELLHFLRRDYRLCMFAHEYENTLTSIIHMAYKHFTEYMVCEVGLFLPAFLSDSHEADKEDMILFKNEKESEQLKEPDVVPHGTLTRQASLTSLYWTATNPRVSRKTKATLGCILSTLKASVSLLHQCRVNSTLSILIFNLLFRYISMRLFNKLVTDPKCCTQNIGTKLIRRLNRLKGWAVKENLTMPAEDHLAIIHQAGLLLQYPKKNPEDVHVIHSMCNRLNSRQVSTLLNNYELAEGEGCIHGHLKNQLISLAAQNVDQSLLSSGMDVNLQEDPNLELPFLIPEQGYSCDTMRGLPVGLEEYLETAINAGFCQLLITKDTLGCWVPPRMTTSNQRESPLSTQASTQMSQTLPKNFLQNQYASLGDHDTHRVHSELNLVGDIGEQLQAVVVKLRKANKTLGINICERKVTVGPNQEELLIFIKSLSEDGPAGKDGRVSVGDQILKVDSTVLKGLSKTMVIKLLSNSGNEVTLMVAKGAAEHYGLTTTLPEASPYTERKGHPVSTQSYGSSHSIKAQRRQMRQQLNDINLKHFSHHPSEYSNDKTARWIQEQRDRSNHRISLNHMKPTRPSQSLNSLIPEKDENSSRPTGSHVNGPSGRNLFDPHFGLNSPPPGSDTSDSIGQLYQDKPHYDKSFGILGNVSRLHDPLSASSSTHSDFSSMYSRHKSSMDLQYSSSADMPGGGNSLSVQMSESSDPNGSQAYPSLMLEKLSLEVGCHTQSNLSSTAGLTVTSVLEQLAQKSREAKGKSGLKKDEVKGLDVDEIELEKQRMKFLFYEQKKEQEDSETLGSLDKQPPMDPNAKVSEWVNKDQDMLTEEDFMMMDPEKILQITNLQSKLDSLKKMVSDQRKKNREIQFAKERVKQSLHEEEKKAQQARNVRPPFVKMEDQTRWQKDQKKRMREWEKVKQEKTNDLQRYEVKERDGRSRLKALEQHLGEIKKQLQACESTSSHRVLSGTGEFGSTNLMDEIPEKDWTSSSRPPRIMSTDSITTESSLMSGDNSEISKDMISIDSDLSIPGLNDFGISATRNSPFSNRSDSSSPIGPVSLYGGKKYTYNPEVHGSMEMRPMPPQVGITKIPLMRGHSADQDKRLQMLKAEHHHHISSMNNIPTYTGDDRFHQIRQEAMQNIDIREQPVLDKSGPPFSKSSTNDSHYKGSIDSSNIESSLSNTPDVIPEFLVKPIHQSSSVNNVPYPQIDGVQPSSIYGKHSRPSSGFGFSDANIHSFRASHERLPVDVSSSDFLSSRMSSSRENLYVRPEKIVSGIHQYSSYGNVSNLHQHSTAGFDVDTHQSTNSSRLNVSKKPRQSNSPSTHKYSHRRPDASLNGAEDRSKPRTHASSHSNLFSIQRQQTEL